MTTTRGDVATPEPAMPRAHRHNVPAARSLRRHETAAERRLWDLLRGRRAAGLKVRRQHPVGTWVLDFCVPEIRLAIELDGPIHAGQQDADAWREAVLADAGYTMVRIPNADVFANPADVVARIVDVANSLGASPPSGGPPPGRHTPRPPQRERGRG